MTFDGWIQIALFCVLIILLVKPLGGYMTRVFAGERTFLSPGAARRSSAASTGCAASTSAREQHWVDLRRRHAAVQPGRASSASTRCMRLQALLPFNPQASRRSSQSLAFNTAVSFATNTNWQSYVPETTMSYLVADGRADRAQLRLGGDRHRARGRAGARLRAALGADASATSGSI